MTAIALTLALAAGIYGYVHWAAVSIAAGAPPAWFVLGAPLAYFTPAIVLVTVSFAMAWIWRTPRPPEARIGAAAALRMYCVEVWTIGISWPLMAFHRLLAHDPPPAPARRPVLLIHGVLVNEGIWIPFRRYLSRSGIAPIYTLNYGPPLADIERFAAQLDAKIDAIRGATGAERVLLVGHSMGGLVARAYLRRFGGSRVAGLITLGTPHHGSVLAYLFFGRSLAQLRPGNAWLAKLNGREFAPGVPITSIWSRHDSMVAPQASSVLERAHNVALVGIAHNALLTNSEVRRRVVREIAECAV
jgi:triacylglycerol esterase/lipase EstA (alpha/beta hydrolase family)